MLTFSKTFGTTAETDNEAAGKIDDMGSEISTAPCVGRPSRLWHVMAPILSIPGVHKSYLMPVIQAFHLMSVHFL